MTEIQAYSLEFRAALALVLKSEGGKVDAKHDAGGRTNRGVTKATYDAWRRAHKQPTRDVFLITEEEVEAIYHNAYAAPVRFDDLPAGVGYCVLDEAIISGPVRAIRHLQQCLGVKQDGVMGAITLARINPASSLILIDDLCDARLSFERCLPDWRFWGRGWSNRVAQVRIDAHRLATPTISDPPKPANANSELSRLG